MLTYEELSENFDAFKKIFANASHAPFVKVTLENPLQVGRRRAPKNQPPELGFIAKIILHPSRDNVANHELLCKEYTYLITSEGGISFKGTAIYKQPKMKWADLITKWIKAETPRLRHALRFCYYKEELLGSIYHPRRINMDLTE